MGELVTAHLKQPGAKIASIYFPDHTAPYDELIQGYGTKVDVRCLGPYGSSFEMVQAMLRWLHEQKGSSAIMGGDLIPTMMMDIVRMLQKDIGLNKLFA